MVNNLKEKINFAKETLATLPTNNKKNKQKYLDYLNGLVLEYTTIRETFLKEIDSRFEKIYIKNNDDIFEKLEDSMFLYKDIFNTLNRWNTPYEKLGLDKWIFKLTHFYQNDFENLNCCIKGCVECFKSVGLVLTEKDFNHSPYVNKYMSLFFCDCKNNDGLKKLFDDLYWKCPNIIFYIALNFRYLYYKNEKTFIKYYQLKAKNILNEKTYDKLREEYKVLIYKIETKDDNIGTLINKLLTKEYNLKDYSKQMKSTYYANLTNEEVEFSNVLKLYDSLSEYAYYLENKYIIEKFKKIYEDKDKYKNIYKDSLKEIIKIERKIIKLNNKYRFYEKYFRYFNKLDNILLKINEQLELVRSKYDELDNNKFYEKISTLNDNLSYFDIMELTSSYYLNIRKIIKEEFKDIDEDNINNKIIAIDKFLDSYNLNILCNIKIRENIDIALVISDRYKLLNFNISKDNIINNVFNLIDYITKLKQINIINKSNISYEELDFLCKVNDMRS